MRISRTDMVALLIVLAGTVASLDGASNDEIGARLGISARTVESHPRRLFERHDVASRTELAARAIREGWLEDVG